MSIADAFDRFMGAAKTFQGLEQGLRSGDDTVDPRVIDEVIIDLDAAIPGLTDVDLGRAMVFKGYALWWRYLLDIRKDVRRAEISILDVAKRQVDPRITAGFKAASEGRELLVAGGTDRDRSWADDVVSKLDPANH